MISVISYHNLKFNIIVSNKVFQQSVCAWIKILSSVNFSLLKLDI